MKKAYYALAGLGVAPALGLLAPAATAAAATTHTQERPAKTVQLSHTGTSPQYTCHPGTIKTGEDGIFHFSISNYGHCVSAQHAWLQKSQTGLTERIRAYSQFGALTFDRRVPGTISGGFTSFPGPYFSHLGWNPVYNICAALVTNGTNNVKYGPICITT